MTIHEGPVVYCNKFKELHRKYRRFDFSDIPPEREGELLTRGFFIAEAYDLDLGMKVPIMVRRVSTKTTKKKRG